MDNIVRPFHTSLWSVIDQRRLKLVVPTIILMMFLLLVYFPSIVFLLLGSVDLELVKSTLLIYGSMFLFSYLSKLSSFADFCTNESIK